MQRILDHEVETAASESLQTRTGLTRGNYDFSLVGESVLDGRPCYLLGLKPKRKEKDLILGKAWVDKNSFSSSVLRVKPQKLLLGGSRVFTSHWRLAILEEIGYKLASKQWLMFASLAHIL